MVQVTPARYILKGIAHFLVIELFVLMALQTHFPRYRRLFSPVEWLLWDIPTDAEYALEQYSKAERAGHHPTSTTLPTNESSSASSSSFVDAKQLTDSDTERTTQHIAPSQMIPEHDTDLQSSSTIDTTLEEDHLIDPVIKSTLFFFPFQKIK